jgi:hypothetical protein
MYCYNDIKFQCELSCILGYAKLIKSDEFYSEYCILEDYIICWNLLYFCVASNMN